MFIGLIAQGNASREYYGYVDKVGIIYKKKSLYFIIVQKQITKYEYVQYVI